MCVSGGGHEKGKQWGSEFSDFAPQSRPGQSAFSAYTENADGMLYMLMQSCVSS